MTLLLSLALAFAPPALAATDTVDEAPAAPLDVEGLELEPDPVAPELIRPEDAPPPRLEDVWAEQGPDAVLDDAIERRARGDFEGASARLAWIEQHHGSPVARYQVAVTHELQERYGDALAGYDAVLQAFPGAAVARDAAFRRALVLEDLDRHREATKQVRQLQRAEKWGERDAVSLAIARGVNELGQGRTRKGLKRLGKALAAVEGSDDLQWMRAKARAALARHLLDEAASIPIRSDRKAQKNLVARAQRISEAEQQVIAAARLGEPEYALIGLELLGDGYMALYDDMMAAPPPTELTAEQADIYSDAVAEKAAVLVRKAWRFYDEGVKLATRTKWQGGVADRLRARRDALGLDAS